MDTIVPIRAEATRYSRTLGTKGACGTSSASRRAGAGAVRARRACSVHAMHTEVPCCAAGTRACGIEGTRRTLGAACGSHNGVWAVHTGTASAPGSVGACSTGRAAVPDAGAICACSTCCAAAVHQHAHTRRLLALPGGHGGGRCNSHGRCCGQGTCEIKVAHPPDCVAVENPRGAQERDGGNVQACHVCAVPNATGGARCQMQRVPIGKSPEILPRCSLGPQSVVQ